STTSSARTRRSVGVCLIITEGDDLRPALFHQVEPAREHEIEAAGAPAANRVADQRSRPLAVAAHDPGARRAVLGLDDDAHAAAGEAALAVGLLAHVQAGLRAEDLQRREAAD